MHRVDTIVSDERDMVEEKSHVKLAQRGQAAVTLQPGGGLLNSLGAGVVKLAV